MLAFAVVHAIQIVGEALAKSAARRARDTREIPWGCTLIGLQASSSCSRLCALCRQFASDVLWTTTTTEAAASATGAGRTAARRGVSRGVEDNPGGPWARNLWNLGSNSAGPFRHGRLVQCRGSFKPCGWRRTARSGSRGAGRLRTAGSGGDVDRRDMDSRAGVRLKVGPRLAPFLSTAGRIGAIATEVLGHGTRPVKTLPSSTKTCNHF